MVVYGYAKEYMYTGDGTLLIRTRIPSIHGPFNQLQADGKVIRKYTQDDNLPWYPSILLPYNPTNGDVVALMSTNESNQSWLIIGLTGGSYANGMTSLN